MMRTMRQPPGPPRVREDGWRAGSVGVIARDTRGHGLKACMEVLNVAQTQSDRVWHGRDRDNWRVKSKGECVIIATASSVNN